MPLIAAGGLRAILRQDLYSFIAKSFETVAPAQTFLPSWHIQAIAWKLQQCLDRKIRRLIVTVPPRYLKSICASVAFPAYILGHDPRAAIVNVSYSNELAMKFARDCRAVMTTRWYRELFPGTRLSRERNAEHDFMTTERGYRLSTSVQGTLTGRGGNFIIVDDAMKPDEAMSQARRRSVCEWVDNTLYTRLDNKKDDVIIAIMQRLHMEDLVGHLLAKGEEWVVLNLPAIAEYDEAIQIGPDKCHVRKVGDLLHAEREDHAVLQAMKNALGSFNFAAQYQQTPIPEDGELFKLNWFRFYASEPARAGNDSVVQSFDTASKAGQLNNYSVCTTWLVKGNDYFLLDVFRQKLGFPDLIRAIQSQADRFRPSSILIEDKASGTALIQELGRTRLPHVPYPIPIEPEADKITRAAQQSAAIEAGHVHLPQKADWLIELRNELVQFPSGRYDDQVDSITQFLKWVRTREIWPTHIETIWPT